jgi:hypothetical protein
MAPALFVGLLLSTNPGTTNEGVVAVLQDQAEATPGWPWMRGGATPEANLGGVIGLSLLQAYRNEPSSAAWVTLIQYADHLRTLYASDDRLPYKADIELFVELDDAGLVADGREQARALFERVRSISPTGRHEYLRIARGRAPIPEIIGYDVALAIRAALAVGELHYAHELADAAIAAGHLELRDASDSFQITSVGALLHALGRLARPGDLELRERAAVDLVQAQGSNGSWAGNDTQATAYAVVGLTVTPSVAPAATAAGTGRRWLLAHQLEDGAWPSYHDGLPAPFVGPVVPLVEAEVLAAVMNWTAIR